MITTSSQHLFKLDINQHKDHTKITMILLTDIVNTKDVPKTYEFLEKVLPSILRSKCYNNKNLPFFQEVNNTEIGHLFEHMLLEYLCKLKVQKGFKKATYSGKTQWDWLKDPKGTFHIMTDTKEEDEEILQEAIKQCSTLMQT